MKGARDLSRRELAVLRELVHWRDGVAAQLDRATFRIVGNEQLLEIARRQPASSDLLSSIKGVPRGMIESRGGEIIGAVVRGLAVPENALPKFAKAPRWDRDPEFDVRVAALKTVRDAAATRLDLDPGVLCARERLEAVARKNPSSPEELADVRELRAWQRGVLVRIFRRCLARLTSPCRRGRGARSGPASRTASRSG
jgi:ribonuclease D